MHNLSAAYQHHPHMRKQSRIQLHIALTLRAGGRIGFWSRSIWPHAPKWGGGRQVARFANVFDSFGPTHGRSRVTVLERDRRLELIDVPPAAMIVIGMMAAAS
jgi:hypothetical protein